MSQGRLPIFALHGFVRTEDMRIAVISTHYDETRYIGAMRPRSISKWLSKMGHQVTVVTRLDPQIRQSAPPLESVQVVRYPRNPALQYVNDLARSYIDRRRAHAESFGAGQVSPGQFEPEDVSLDGAQKWSTVPVVAYSILDDLAWAFGAAYKIRRQGDPQYDVILSSFGPFASHWLAMLLRRMAPNAVWIADFRDPMAASTFPKLIRRTLGWVQAQSTRSANLVTTVSQGLADEFSQLYGSSQHPPIHVVTNGVESSKSPVKDRHGVSLPGALRITYTGTLYAGRSRPEALFKALGDMHTEGLVSLSEIELHYAGRDGGQFRGIAALHGLDGIVTDHGFLAHEEAKSLQAASDILVVLSWNFRGSTGILTGKIFDYMMSGRPIVSIVSGELPGAELTRMVRSLNLGYAFEYSSGADARIGLRRYLRVAIESKRNVDSVPSTYSADVLDSFRYENIVRDLERKIQEIRR